MRLRAQTNLASPSSHLSSVTVGNNTIAVYVAEAPADAKDSVGVFRVLTTRVNYRLGPPEERTPA